MITDNNQDNPNPDSKQDAPENQPENKTDEKKFTQAEVNTIVQNRISKFKDYDVLKTQVAELNTLKTEHSGLKEKLTTSEQALQSVLDNTLAEIDEDKRNLIPENFSVTEKLSYIQKNKATLLSKVVKPNLPNEDKEKGDSSLYGGKYKTLMEFAEKAPKEYLKYRSENP